MRGTMIVKIERLDDFGRGIAYINNKITFIETIRIVASSVINYL